MTLKTTEMLTACTVATEVLQLVNHLLYLCLTEYPLQRTTRYCSKHICVSLPDICSAKRSVLHSGDKNCLPHYYVLP